MRAFFPGIFILTFGLLFSCYAQPIPVDSSNIVTFNFDFSAEQPPPPYQNINFQIFFGADDFDHGDGFTIQAFKSSGVAVSNPISILNLGISSGGGLESGFGGPAGQFFGVLTEATGYLLMNDIVGTFDVTGGRVLAADLNFFPPGTPWIDFSSLVVREVPVPGTIALFVVGLLGMGWVSVKSLSRH